ncbi:AAA family ATPase [Elizabethkingia bruuniana]|uniref:AAA family ATPase n=1 Tax=Elizabethkingia bruuniana TaxID=1756149 RepID=UPI0024201395|nr:AAA family ATPase [Elizabethkingia bruuniana]
MKVFMCKKCIISFQQVKNQINFMRLSAIYIPSGVLKHIFGEDHPGQTINLGGKYIYTFEENAEDKVFLKDKKENTKFIENFWLNNIQLVSAIVGANGTGKTSLLRHLIKELSSTPTPRNCIFIYEGADSVTIKNETGLEFSDTSGIQFIGNNSELSEEFLYYSPNLDYDLRSIHSPISLVNYHEQSLENYYLSNIRRHLFFLKDKEIVSSLKRSYEDFPSYSKLVFKAKSLYKSDFEKVYIQSTLGNKLFRIRNQLLSEVQRSSNEAILLNKDSIEYIFEKNESIQDELVAIWDIYPNSIEGKQQYINGGNDFINDIEINILSYLVLEDTFALDGDYGAYSLSNVLKAENFEEKLTHFLRKFIIQASEIFYNLLDVKNFTIGTSNFTELKSAVQKLSNPDRTFKQVNFEDKAKKVLKQIYLIESIHNFYTALIAFQNQKYCIKIEGGFEASKADSDIDAFNELIGLYEKMLSNLNWSNLGGVLEIKSEKKLSTGEKSLLDFYASVYDYLKRGRENRDMYPKNCVLLLDEPEQGYHPFWKKKFVKALTTTLPILFDVNDVVEQIQIIITTHDPLTLSDIPNDNIVYLHKTTDGKTELLGQLSKQRPTKTFGANISDLLADSFFVNDGLIGDFAKEKIEKTIEWINYNKESKNRNADTFSKELDYHKKVISIIDEPVVKIKLSEMISELEDANDFQRQILDDEIRFLTEKRNKLL